MRRTKCTIAALAIAVSSLAALCGTAMADGLNCRDAWGNWIRCDGTYYAPVDNWWGSNDWWWGNDWWWNGGGVVQSSEQEVESGQATQSFDIS